MKRLPILGAALAAACFSGNEPATQAQLHLSPLLDSLFVGDTQAPRLTATYVTSRGDTQAVRLTWQTNAAGVATVDTGGRVVAVGRGEAVISASAGGVTGRALVIVNRELDVSLLLDTIYLMPGDTFRVPVEVLRRDGAPPAPVFEAPAQAVFTIDPSGLVTATAAGNPQPFVVRADSVADTGAVHVRVLQDTTGGRGYVTLLGTVIQRRSAPARALNYRLRDNSQAFRIAVSVTSGGQLVDNMIVTLRDSITAPGTFFVDSLSPAEALGIGADFICEPARPWAIWGSAQYSPPINALSRRGGAITILRIDTLVVGGDTVGHAISGHFEFLAQRMDYYEDPGGLIPVRGTFVAPLITNLTTCP